MDIIYTVVVAALLAAPALVAEQSTTYVGVITDSMCGSNHKSMNVSPDSKCVRECVGDGKTFQYALADGRNIYRLSDQETPAKFAAQKVKVTGVLYAKTNIIKVERIEAAESAPVLSRSRAR